MPLTSKLDKIYEETYPNIRTQRVTENGQSVPNVECERADRAVDANLQVRMSHPGLIMF